MRGEAWCARGRGGWVCGGVGLPPMATPTATMTADTTPTAAMAVLRARNGFREPGQAAVVVVVCMPGASPQHSFGLGQVLVGPVAHTHALRPRTPRRPCALPRRPAPPLASVRRGRLPGGRDHPGQFRPLDGRGHVQPRQHVMQAGDPQTQRVKADRAAWSVSMIAGIPERKLNVRWQWPGSI